MVACEMLLLHKMISKCDALCRYVTYIICIFCCAAVVDDKNVIN